MSRRFLLFPDLYRARVGAVWDLRKRTYPAEFIAMLATVVNTSALVFSLASVGYAALPGPAATFLNIGDLGLTIAQLAFGYTGLAVAFFAANDLVQHTQGLWEMSRGGRLGAGFNGSVHGAVSAAHLVGERKPVLIRGWPSPAAPHALIDHDFID